MVAPGIGTVAAARQAMRRLAPQLFDAHDARIGVELGGEGASRFVYAASVDGGITVSGTDVGSALTGFHRYLEDTGLGQVSRGGDRVAVPEVLPVPEAPVVGHSPYRYRYATNFTVTGYTAAYWTWSDWERELDLLAATGINLSLVAVGSEAVWLDTFTRFGFDEKTVLEWLAPPAHFPFQLMGNLSGFGGITRRLVEERAALGRRVTERMRQLDIEPVLPGFAGLVPGAIDGVEPIDQGDWSGFHQPGWLASTEPVFGEVAAVFYAAQAQRLGETRAQAVDLLHEGGHSGGVDLGAATRGVAAAMERAHPDYLWVLQAWWENPLPEVLAATDDDHLLLLDLTGRGWRQRDGWGHKPWASGSITNFGGRTIMSGSLPRMAKLPSVRREPEASGLVGTALVAEALPPNPAAWSLFARAAWHEDDIDLDAWLPRYVAARYGAAHPKAVRAWHGLLGTVYRETGGDNGGAESLLCAVPDLEADRVSAGGPRSLPYPAEALEVAWRDLLAARGDLGAADTFQYDLVNLTRQVISNRARTLLPLLRTAFKMGEAKRFTALSHSFLDLFELLEPVLASRPEFLLGRWLAAARGLGDTAEERAALEFDARTILTTWGDSARTSAILRDYANREWAGLISGYYRPRWERYLASLATALAEGGSPEPVDFYALAAAWARSEESYPAEPTGDPVATCRAVHHALPYFEGLP